MRAPLDILAQGQGLCMDGCSSHTYLTTRPNVNKWVESCVAASNQALFSCVLYSNTFNTFLDITNDSYILVCQFELLMTGSNDTLRFIRAVANDATLLPNTENLRLPGRMVLSAYLSSFGISSPTALDSTTSQTNTAGTALSTSSQGTTAYNKGHEVLDTLTASSGPPPLPPILSLAALAATLISLNR